jgi:predicted nucleotidyltransferase component of viral defense system
LKLIDYAQPTLLESTLIDSLMPALLSGIASAPALAGNLVLKGGAALRQFYFADARYSNDLDFSALSQLPSAAVLTASVQEAALVSGNLLGVGRDVRLYVEEVERQFKPVPLRSFHFVYEWNHHMDVRVAVEISLDETIVRSPAWLPLLHVPSRLGSRCPAPGCLVYTLDEIVAEKMRALLQWKRQLKEKNRRDMPVARTCFDLHFLLSRHRERISHAGFAQLLTDKCRTRDVDFLGAASFFDEELIGVAKQKWTEQIAPVMSAPPAPAPLLAELEELVRELIV